MILCWMLHSIGGVDAGLRSRHRVLIGSSEFVWLGRIQIGFADQTVRFVSMVYSSRVLVVRMKDVERDGGSRTISY